MGFDFRVYNHSGSSTDRALWETGDFDYNLFLDQRPNTSIIYVEGSTVSLDEYSIFQDNDNGAIGGYASNFDYDPSTGNFILHAEGTSPIAGSGLIVNGYSVCTTAGGTGCGGGVPSVNGITSAVTVAAGAGVSVGTSGSTVTVTNSEPLNASGLEGVLAASPYNIGSSSYCGSGAIYTSPSADGLIQCDGDTLNSGNGSWILFGDSSPYAPGIELYGPSSYISLLSNQPGTFGAGIQLLGDDTTSDGGSGTEYLHNAAGDATVSLTGAYGSGIFSGGMTAKIYQETLTTPSSSSATCTSGQFTDDANYHYVCVSSF
jgi:hypothetical protein